jgi:hypothetical protein
LTLVKDEPGQEPPLPNVSLADSSSAVSSTLMATETTKSPSLPPAALESPQSPATSDWSLNLNSSRFSSRSGIGASPGHSFTVPWAVHKVVWRQGVESQRLAQDLEKANCYLKAKNNNLALELVRAKATLESERRAHRKTMLRDARFVCSPFCKKWLCPHYHPAMPQRPACRHQPY